MAESIVIGIMDILLQSVKRIRYESIYINYRLINLFDKKSWINKRYANVASYPQIIHTPEVRRKISLGNKGKKLSEEAKRKISLANKGRKHTEETIRKFSLSLKGRIISEEHRGKLSAALKGRKGLPRSEETKRKLSIINKGKKVPEETRRKI